jgi:hypothetical protein
MAPDACAGIVMQINAAASPGASRCFGVMKVLHEGADHEGFPRDRCDLVGKEESDGHRIIGRAVTS